MKTLLTNADYLTIPEGQVRSIQLDESILWEKHYTNLVYSSINADGTIYNGGLGYKEGYRIRSGGAEAEYNSVCTGFIPVKAGDIVRLSGWDFSVAQNGNAINVSDSNFTNIGQFTMLNASYGIFLESAYSNYSYSSVIKESDNVWKWVVPPTASGVAYIRVTAYNTTGTNMIVAVNEQIK